MDINDSAIKRGDRADTGDNQARPTEKGSGPAHATFDPTSSASLASTSTSTGNLLDLDESEADGIEVMEPGDGRLGLTGYEGAAADDWAANTGETRTPEEGH